MTAAKKPAPTPLWMWLVWLALSALTWGGIFVIGTEFIGVFMSPLPLSDHFWFYQLTYEIMPVVGVLALVAPFLGLAALIFRIGRPLVLVMIGVIAAAQFAYVGLENYLSAVLPEPWLGGGLEGLPAASEKPGRR